ncbi:hypothetical protein RRG08_001101 [Elysia crispata]|uniref:Uncharacterized protein n=1 Tax=Elysia crispata TaxID=231223 RepID=A0AAE1E647_9GAST|nr:hypothetical protein RRG08_001101 [Elysia crispata]
MKLKKENFKNRPLALFAMFGGKHLSWMTPAALTFVVSFFLPVRIYGRTVESLLTQPSKGLRARTRAISGEARIIALSSSSWCSAAIDQWFGCSDQPRSSPWINRRSGLLLEPLENTRV